jgi:hypothetical protein
MQRMRMDVEASTQRATVKRINALGRPDLTGGESYSSDRTRDRKSTLPYVPDQFSYWNFWYLIHLDNQKLLIQRDANSHINTKVSHNMR